MPVEELSKGQKLQITHAEAGAIQGSSGGCPDHAARPPVRAAGREGRQLPTNGGHSCLPSRHTGSRLCATSPSIVPTSMGRPANVNGLAVEVFVKRAV